MLEEAWLDFHVRGDALGQVFDNHIHILVELRLDYLIDLTKLHHIDGILHI